LPASFIDEAFDRLESVSVVVGPSLDGGYYLIGATSPLPDLFSHQNWGTETVMTQTLERLNEKGRSTHLLPFWFDIDRPRDIAFLRAYLNYLRQERLTLPKATHETIKRLKEKTR